MEIKNLEKASDRLKKAAKNGERIILYGDADLDGVSSTIIVKEALEKLGCIPDRIYFPDRENEGYGLNKKALNLLKKRAPAVLVVLDCGIGNFEEIQIANSLGFETIIVDHHEILAKIPLAKIIVDPKQKGDDYPHKNLATVGIAFRLAKLILGKGIDIETENSFLELAAVATIADMMPQIGENAEIIEKGVRSIKNTKRPGFKIFWEMLDLGKLASTREFCQRLVSIMNISARKKRANNTFYCLSAKSFPEAEIYAKDLIEHSIQRSKRIKEVFEEIKDRVGKKEEIIVFEGSDGWSQPLLGAVATRVLNEFKKPVFVFRRGIRTSVGAVRVPAGINSVKAMESCSELLITYGGHPPASGFSIKTKNLAKFKEGLLKYFQQ